MRTPVFLCCLLGLITAISPAVADESIWGLDFRYRLEFVDEQGFDQNAYASTLRTRLRMKSHRWNGFQAFMEGAQVSAIGLDDYNAGAGSTPDRTQFPVVADPEDTRLNQFWLDWQWSKQIAVRIGRQRIKLDNDRFIGNVGWRQNEQTYDALSLSTRLGKMDAYYAYIDQVNRIFDGDVPAGRQGHDTHLLHWGLELTEGHRLATYLYAIDNRDFAGLSNQTWGVRYQGQADPSGQHRLNWLAEWAVQTDAGDNPIDYRAHYLHARLDLTLASGWKPVLGFERLSGSTAPGRALRTPLATLHAFNGWADRFLTTPDQGLDDWYAGLSGSTGPVNWQVYGHWFRTDAGSETLGHEFDAALGYSFNHQTSLLVKAARFSGHEQRVPSATKLWFQLSFTWP